MMQHFSCADINLTYINSKNISKQKYRTLLWITFYLKKKSLFLSTGLLLIIFLYFKMRVSERDKRLFLKREKLQRKWSIKFEIQQVIFNFLQGMKCYLLRFSIWISLKDGFYIHFMISRSSFINKNFIKKSEIEI